MALQEVGVEAIVKGLSAFQSDMGKINQSLQGLRSEGTFLQRAFGGITEGILNFGARIADVATVALGVLLRDAIRAVVDGIKELISATIEAGNEFQTLEIRLGRLNLNSLVESGMDYNEAMAESVKVTKEQLQWILKLAAASPYDATDVADTFTLARSYGFVSDEAQSLTKDILNFTSGMGLSNVEVRRIIINFGQMVQQGKVTQRELNDLARGAFVPVNDILAEMQKQTGLTGGEFDKFKSSTEGVNAFMNAFSAIVERRFGGAMEEMSNTFKASTGNVLDLVKGIFGLNTVTPILDTLGKRVAEFANAFTDNPERWERLVNAAEELGDILSEIIGGIFDMLPGTETLADNIVAGIEALNDFIWDNRENIIGFFRGIGDTIQNNVVPFIRDQLIPAIGAFIGWLIDNKDQILGFFMDLGATIINDVVPFVRDNLIPAFQYFGEWFMANREQILLLFDKLGDAILELANIIIPILQKAMDWIVAHPELVEKMIIAWAQWQVIGTILSVVGGIILSLIGFVLGLVSAIVGVIGVVNFVMPLFTALGTIIGAVSLPVVALIAAIGALVYVIVNFGAQAWTSLQQLDAIWNYYFAKMVATVLTFGYNIRQFLEQKWAEISNSVSTWWGGIVEKFRNLVNQIVDVFRNINWGGIGSNIVQGIANGISSSGGLIANAAKNAASIAFDAATAMLGIHSPSTLFMEVGADTMQGLALGIQKSAGVAAATMQAAMARVSSSAMPGTTNSTTYNNTSNYNLTVNSGASSEPILQDFEMLASLAGV